MNANIPVLFRSYQSQETHSGCLLPISICLKNIGTAEVAQAASQIMQPLIDGGLGCNNPSKLLLKEAKVVFPTHQTRCLLSIRTGQAELISIRKPGFFQQIVPTDVIDALKAISTDCEATHNEMLLLFANSPNIYF